MTGSEPLPQQAEQGRPAQVADGLRRRATLAAVAVSALLIAIKAVAWIMTDSVAILGSLMDSGLDFLASLITFFAVRVAMSPPDHEHRFGHGKADSLAGLGRGLLILVSAGFVGMEAVGRLVEPQMIRAESVALWVMGVSALASLLLALYQYYAYRQTRSLAIGADAANYGADVLVSIGAGVAVWLSAAPAYAMADPLFGFAIAIVIGVSAVAILVQSYDQLMDREVEDRHREQLKKIILAHPDVEGVHDLRTRRAGAHLFIQFHLELDPDMTLREAHRIADAVEASVRAVFPDADVIAHQEPVGEFIENELVKT